MAGLTLGEALSLPAFKRSAPVVLAGGSALTRRIRWVHATELTDLGDLLRAGDLVLTMGTGLPPDEDEQAFGAFAQVLADVECAGLVLELGRRWPTDVPAALVRAFEARGVALVALTHETRFAALAQEIGEQIIDGQLAELRDAQRVHETFTELSFTQAGPGEVLEAVQRLAGGPVVLENAQHRPLDYLAGSEDMSSFLDGWQKRSARVDIPSRTGWDERNGWLVTRLGTGDHDWGRLVISSPHEPSQRLIAVAERAAAALALHRLHHRHRDDLMRRTHQELMLALQASPTSEEVLRRCDLAGFPTRKRQFLGLVVRPRSLERGPLDLNELAAAGVRSAHSVRVPALVCEVDGDVRILLSAAPSQSLDSIADRLGQQLGTQLDVVVAAGRVAAEATGVERSLMEATQVADAVPEGSAPGAVAVHRLEDLHLRGLLALFGDDDRLRLFTERELGPLREHDGDPESRTDLMPALRALVTHPGSKTEAAASLHLSRAAFYDRLAKIQSILGVNLDDPDVRVSLHVALVADDLSRADRS
jgi:PucR family transcriptional regulator, purine catabolism regulatory protein